MNRRATVTASNSLYERLAPIKPTPLNRHRGDLNRRSSRLKRIFFEVPNRIGRAGQREPVHEIARTYNVSHSTISRLKA